MLRRAASRACGTLLASRLQHTGSPLQKGGFQCRPFYTLRYGTRPSFSPSSSNGLGDLPPRRSLTQFYLYLLAKHPLITKSVTASVIYAAADVSRQGVVRFRMPEHPEKASWNMRKTMQAAAIGLFVAGPVAHYWFNFVSKVIPAQNLISSLKKMVMEQLILAPITTLGVFSFTIYGLGKSFDEIMSELKPVLPLELRSELFYWPASSFLIYHHVPVHLQPLARNSAFFVWSIMFTYLACSAGQTAFIMQVV